MKKKKKPWATLETIAPSKAAEYYDSMIDNNRGIKSRNLSKLVADISDGQWITNGETIKFDEDGCLFDGQHRLLACIKAGTAIESFVVRGLPRELSMATVDGGSARGANDFLTFKGHANTSSLASAARVLQWIRLGQPPRSKSRKRAMGDRPIVTSAAISRFIDANPLLVHVISTWRAELTVEPAGLMSPSVMIPLFLECSLVCGTEPDEDSPSWDFFHGVAKGTSVASGSLMHKTRQRLYKMNAEGVTTGRVLTTPLHKVNFMIQMWNHFVSGDRVPKKIVIAHSEKGWPSQTPTGMKEIRSPHGNE